MLRRGRRRDIVNGLRGITAGERHLYDSGQTPPCQRLGRLLKAPRIFLRLSGGVELRVDAVEGEIGARDGEDQTLVRRGKGDVGSEGKLLGTALRRLRPPPKSTSR